MPYCGKCGSPISVNHRFCGKCGTPVSTQSNVNETTPSLGSYMNQITSALNRSDIFDAHRLCEEAYIHYPNSVDAMTCYASSLSILIALDEEASAYGNEDFRSNCINLLNVAIRLKSDVSHSGDAMKYESQAHYGLGRYYKEHNDNDAALREFKQVDIKQRPFTAYYIAGCHISIIGVIARCLPVNQVEREAKKYASEFRNDVELINYALASTVISNMERAALLLTLSIIYAIGYPGISKNTKYAYDCVKQAYSISPELASEELDKYSMSRSGEIVYTP